MIKAPWTDEQVKNLNDWQTAGIVHPFTCGGKRDGKDCRADLVATKDGWVCPEKCGYTQDWAHAMMAKESVKEDPIFKKFDKFMNKDGT
jgi:hypothetical protein